MTSNVTPMFTFGDNNLRCEMVDGEPWFVAADVCRSLKLNMRSTGRPNVTHSLAGLTDDEKGVAEIHTLGGKQRVVIVSRPGLFKLIARSNKPEAREFDRWVRHEVLPQIMDNGGYLTPQADLERVSDAAGSNNPLRDLDLFKSMLSVMEAAKGRIAELEAARAADATKVAFVDEYVAANGGRCFDDVARTLGLGSGAALCALLRDNDVLFRRNKVNYARKVHLDAGRFEQKTIHKFGAVRSQTIVTACGVAWLAEQLPTWLAKQAAKDAHAHALAESRARVAAALQAA